MSNSGASHSKKAKRETQARKSVRGIKYATSKRVRTEVYSK